MNKQDTGGETQVWDLSYKTYIPRDAYRLYPETENGDFGVMVKDWRSYRDGEYFYDKSQLLQHPDPGGESTINGPSEADLEWLTTPPAPTRGQQNG